MNLKKYVNMHNKYGSTLCWTMRAMNVPQLQCQIKTLKCGVPATSELQLDVDTNHLHWLPSGL